MARHLTWCLKRTFVLTSCFNVNLHPRLVAKVSNSGPPKPYIGIAGVTKMDTDTDELREFEMFEEDAKHGMKLAVTSLRKILCISEAKATKAVAEYPAFKLLSKRTIYENFHFLRESGMFKSTIKDNKFLLAAKTDELKTKISLIKRLELNINDAVALFHLGINVLERHDAYTQIDASYLPARNKIWYLAERFKCDISKICQAVSYQPWILTIPPPKLMTITEYVLAAGMKPEHILGDLVLYRYPLNIIEAKVQEAKRLGINPIKPWIMRCSAHLWERAREKFEGRGGLPKPQLDHLSREGLLCSIFGCSAEVAKSILMRGPKMLVMSMDKLNTNALLIRSEGYEAEDLMMSTIIIQRNTDTLQKRFEMWRESGLPKPRLFVFSMSWTGFSRLIARKLEMHQMAQKAAQHDVDARQ